MSSLWQNVMIFALFCMRNSKIVHIGHLKRLHVSAHNIDFSVRIDAEWLWIGWKQFIRTFSWLFVSLFRQKVNNTWCSQSFSHPCTNPALRCLTSMIGQKLMHWTCNCRTQWHLKQICFCIRQHSFIQYRFTHFATFFHFFRFILMMTFPTEDYLIRVRSIGQLTTFAVCFQRRLLDRVGVLSFLIGLAQQLGF